MHKTSNGRCGLRRVRYWPDIRFFLTLLICLICTACNVASNLGTHPLRPPVTGAVAFECAPFARMLTGVSLHGAAASWWAQADGRYARTQTPHIGGILVLHSTSHMPNGHVAVVSEVVSPRRVLVIHANWVPRLIEEDQPVEDVSEAGDWSEVRVWWPPAKQFGTQRYRAFGFIRPDHSLDRTTITAAISPATKIAAGTR